MTIKEADVSFACFVNLFLILKSDCLDETESILSCFDLEEPENGPCA